VDDIKRALEGRKVLIFYVGSIHGSQNLKQLHHDLIDLGFRQAKHCAIIYVSTDARHEEMQVETHNKPYFSMVFQDGSDFAPMVRTEEEMKVALAEVTDVARDEWFVSAEDLEAEEELYTPGQPEDEDSYARPLSRAAMCRILNALSTPSLSVYHIPSHSFVSTNTRKTAFRPNQIDKNFRTWKEGGKASWGLIDTWENFRLPIIIAILGMLYQLMVAIGGQEYNFIPGVFKSLAGSHLAEPGVAGDPRFTPA